MEKKTFALSELVQIQQKHKGRFYFVTWVFLRDLGATQDSTTLRVHNHRLLKRASQIWKRYSLTSPNPLSKYFHLLFLVVFSSFKDVPNLQKLDYHLEEVSGKEENQRERYIFMPFLA